MAPPIDCCFCSHTAGYLSALHIVDRAVLEDASSSTSDQVMGPVYRSYYIAPLLSSNSIHDAQEEEGP